MKREILVCGLSALIITACGSEQDQGAFLILELDNSAGIDQYTTFNPGIDIDDCKKTAEAAIPSILAAAPPPIPKDSRVKSWRCSVTPPEKGG